jgi:glycine/D-amino acid oxidase-like deaminating enzyme/nitrite reductase/ring-hydroxylating ferredoxin subunit
MARFAGMAAHESLWRQTVQLPHYLPLASDLEVDVAVAGAGITGLTAALLLKRAGLRVAVLEQGRVARGVSGFTTAHITEALDTRWYRLRADFGAEGARLAARSQRAAIERIAALVAEEKIECAFRRLPGWLFTEDEGGATEIGKEAEAAGSLGLRVERGLPPLPFPIKAALRFDDQAQFQPVEYLGALARLVHGDGSFVFEDTRIARIEDGEPCRVRSGDAAVRCRDVVVATHSPVNDRFLLQTKLAQYRSYVVAAVTQAPLDALYWDTGDPYHYLRSQQVDGRWALIVGGEDHKVGQKGDTRTPYALLRKWVRERFPGAAPPAPEPFPYEWSAQVVETVDGLPYVGRNPTDGHIWVATGYAGNGMTHGTMAAMLLSDLIRGKENPWAALYDPSRLHPGASWPTWVKENVDYPLHLVLDRVRKRQRRTAVDLAPGEGQIVEIDGEKVAVSRGDDATVTMLSPVCTHMGCEVRWNPAERSWDCPCHGGRFDPQGNVLDGPPDRPLPPKRR